MSNIISQYRKSKENENFYIGRNAISGIQSAVISYELPFVPLKFIGMSSGCLINNGVLGGTLNLSCPLITYDSFLQYTGISGFNGYLIEDKNNITRNFSFTSGYITNYHHSCQIGAIPQISITASIVGNIGNLLSSENSIVSGDLSYISSNSSSSLPIKLASYGSIDLSLAAYSTNRVLSYDINMTIPRRGIYILGTGVPIDMQINWPIEVELSFQYAVDTYLAQNARNSIANPFRENISLTLKDFNDSSIINIYSFSGAQLISESVNASNQSDTIISAKYKAYITR